MKTGTKIGISLGVASIAGITAAVVASDKIIEKLQHESTRYKTKKIVNEKLGGNEKILDLVDDLSDNELDSIEHVLREVKSGRNKLASYSESVKNTTENLKDRFSDTISKFDNN